jgi:CheY-like chemotaxis protein
VTESRPIVLVVEDNPITRKLFRVTLESAAYRVTEAGDGREALESAHRDPPALVLQDLRLSDMTGFELAERLRALPQCTDAPIIAVSGLLSRAEESGLSSACFQDFLAKPVEPSRLLQVVAAYLPPAGAEADLRPTGRSVLVVDDEPVQRKLAALRLGALGYVVETAADGQEALSCARHKPPDAIVSDVLMPTLDGFGLCRAVRQDPRLAGVPVVLVSSAYIEEEDRALATRVGADACVVRTPELSEVIAALTATESADRVPPRLVANEFMTTAHLQRVVRQLERQVVQVGTLTRRNASLTAQLSALEGIARLLTRTVDVDRAAGEILAHCLQAGSVSLGALYLRHAGGTMALRAAIGFDSTAESFFGHASLLEQLVGEYPVLGLPSPQFPEPAGHEILERSGSQSLIVATIQANARPTGALVMGSRAAGLDTEEWLTFARVVGTQLGHTLTLAQGAGGSAPVARITLVGNGGTR